MKRMTKSILHTRLVLIGLILILVLMAIPAYFWMKDTNKYLAAQHNSRMSPIIMVPEVQQHKTALIRLSVNLTKIALKNIVCCA